ncbi:MAG: hypothetical protein U0X39_14445 [Bacteroidales bacterium]
MKNLEPEADETRSDRVTPESVIEAFRAEEEKTRKSQIVSAIVLVILATIYFTILSGNGELSAAGMMLIGLGFLMGALYIRLSVRRLPESMYMLPLVSFLAFAEKRLRYLPSREIFRITPILIVLGVGGGMTLAGSLMKYNLNITVVTIIWVVFFIGLCIFGYFAGKKDWKKKYGMLIDMIEKAKKELDS